MRYKISQKLNLEADLSNIKVNESEELLKFNPSLIIGYESEENGINYKIDIRDTARVLRKSKNNLYKKKATKAMSRISKSLKLLINP